jgi:hypothetical protein
MKILKNLIYGMLAATVMTFASCNVNDYPTFNDSDAFVAMTSNSASVTETGDSLVIPVLLSSLSGVSGSVDFEIVPDSLAPAVEGKNFTVVNTTKTLTFTKDANTQYIKLKIIDNSTYNGDVKLTINLLNAQGVNLGANKSISVTIEDDEHPLAFMLGTFSAKGPSDFNGDTEWSVTITKDDKDVSKVWIYNLVPGGSSASTPVYGIVNDAKTELRIPVKQTVAKSASYPHIYFEGFYGPDGETDIPSGGYVTGVITKDASGNAIITFSDYFGSHVYTDDAATASAGWYNIMDPGVVLKK